VLHAVVTGPAGERIQRWREAHDEDQARRYRPHVTLVYRVPDVDLGALERQLRYAFPGPIDVDLGGFEVFDNAEETGYVAIETPEALDEARRRLYDATHLELPGAGAWRWHITCQRSTRGCADALLEQARAELADLERWRVDLVALLELAGDRYTSVAEWRL
jgi:2'-5' RNA ligase